MNTAVLFLIFNRPDKTSAVLDTIRAARPARLYVAADGPRTESEAALCAQTRAVIDSVDWPCEVQTLYREQNLGCGRAVSQAIGWFFEHEPEGIILEDDILVDPDFFVFAAEMLERYRDIPHVTTISANNQLPAERAPEESYYFSAFTKIWGWASWRRAWAHYDFELTGFNSRAAMADIARMCPTPGGVPHWMRIFREVHRGRIDTWDYQWLYSQWRQGGLSIIPQVNMMRNIGFDASGTHTTSGDAWEATLRAHPLPRPLVHPAAVQRDVQRDDFEARNILNIRPPALKKRIKRWLRGDRSAWL